LDATTKKNLIGDETPHQLPSGLAKLLAIKPIKSWGRLSSTVSIQASGPSCPVRSPAFRKKFSDEILMSHRFIEGPHSEQQRKRLDNVDQTQQVLVASASKYKLQKTKLSLQLLSDKASTCFRGGSSRPFHLFRGTKPNDQSLNLITR
jgi:hypothetical protein